MQKKKLKKKVRVTVFVSEINLVGNYPDLEKLAHVIQHGLQGFIVKNIGAERAETNSLSHFFVEVGLLGK